MKQQTNHAPPEHAQEINQEGQVSEESQEKTPQEQADLIIETIKKLEQDKEELGNRLQRSVADYQNLKKQTDADRAHWIKYANELLFNNILNFVDDLDRALATVPETIATSDWYKGLQIAKSSLDKFLTAEGLVRIDTKDKPFDPNLHEAICQQPTAEVPEDQVLSEVRGGYTLQDKVIRHAQVIVSKNP